jgi:hypothetical protein
MAVSRKSMVMRLGTAVGLISVSSFDAPGAGEVDRLVPVLSSVQSNDVIRSIKRIDISE